MAKKKKKHQVDNNKTQTEEAAAAQFENLENLNKLLLTETKDRRKQVEALVLSKGSLEAALTRSETEKDSLRAELTQLLDCKDAVELEKMVVSVFVDDRLEAVERERDELMREKAEVVSKVINSNCISN